MQKQKQREMRAETERKQEKREELVKERRWPMTASWGRQRHELMTKEGAEAASHEERERQLGE